MRYKRIDAKLDWFDKYNINHISVENNQLDPYRSIYNQNNDYIFLNLMEYFDFFPSSKKVNSFKYGGNSADLLHEFIVLDFEYPNADLLNISTLYSHILCIEICIVLCVLITHFLILESDKFELKSYDPIEFFSAAVLRWYNFGVQYYIRRPDFSFNSIGIGHELESFLDFFFLILPTLIIIYILIPSLGLLYNNELEFDSSDYSFSIEVVGHQWYWSYQYKIDWWILFDFNIQYTDLFDSVLILEEPRLLSVDTVLTIPSYTNILLVITSADVIHSWSLPSAGIKIDAIPGRVATIPLILYAERFYYGQCSELCGVYHGFMPIVVRCISRNLFFSFITNTDYSTLWY